MLGVLLFILLSWILLRFYIWVHTRLLLLGPRAPLRLTASAPAGVLSQPQSEVVADPLPQPQPAVVVDVSSQPQSGVVGDPLPQVQPAIVEDLLLHRQQDIEDDQPVREPSPSSTSVQPGVVDHLLAHPQADIGDHPLAHPQADIGADQPVREASSSSTSVQSGVVDHPLAHPQADIGIHPLAHPHADIGADIGADQPEGVSSSSSSAHNPEDEQAHPQPSSTAIDEILELGDDTSTTLAATNPVLDTEEQQQTSPSSIFWCIYVTLLGGLIIGYLLNVMGGLLGMDAFLARISHKIYIEKAIAAVTNYCGYIHHPLPLFTVTIHVTTMVSVFVAMKLSKWWALKPVLMSGAFSIISGICLTTWFPHISIEILGMILLGIGVGFIYQVIPSIYSYAPEERRNTINMVFQISLSIGAMLALVVNYIASHYHIWGWRLSFGAGGLAAVPFLFGSYMLPPVEVTQARDSFRHTLRPRSRPLLCITTISVIYSQLAGLGFFTFFGPLLLQSVGYEHHESYLAPLVVGVIGTASTCCLAYLLRFTGRRNMLLMACITTIASQLYLFSTITHVNPHPLKYLNKGDAFLLIGVAPIYAVGSAALAEPHGWVKDSFPEESKDFGLAWSVSLTMLMMAFIAQVSIHVICIYQVWTFLFLAAIAVSALAFVFLFVPETEGVEEDVVVDRVWSQHWYWRRFMMRDQGVIPM